MEYIQDIILDVNSNAAYTTIGAKQADNNSRIVKVHVVKDNDDYNLQAEGVTSAYFRFRKPDGKAVINPADIDFEKNIITVVFTSQTLAAAGRGYGDITLMSGSMVLSTISFIVVIMASPQVAQEAVSSNEFGYLNAVVEDATHTIYEAQAWATGYRGSEEVYGEDLWSTEIFSSRIRSVVIDQDKFKTLVGSKPGTKRQFNFTYKTGGIWQLTLTIIEGNTSTTFLPEDIASIYGYIDEIVYVSGYEEPVVNDSIVVTFAEHDNAYQNNAKYYAELANERKEAIEALTASAEKVYAEDFYNYKSYTAGTYVWYSKYMGDDPDTGVAIYKTFLYRFLVDHDPGAWDESEVIEEFLVEKNTEATPAHLHFKVPQGPIGEVNFVTFDVDMSTGILMMESPEYINPQMYFTIQSPNIDATSPPSVLAPGDGNLIVNIVT